MRELPEEMLQRQLEGKPRQIEAPELAFAERLLWCTKLLPGLLCRSDFW